jgi:hypothetical protein
VADIPVLASVSYAAYIQILKFKFLKCLNLFHTSIALRVSAYSAILRCFEIVVEIAALLYAVMLLVNKDGRIGRNM